MAVVTFDPAAFNAAFPAFATLPDGVTTSVFTGYTPLVLDNTDASPVQDAVQRSTLLNLLVAHFCAILYGENGQAPSGAVGRVNSASEGSVSASMDAVGGLDASWFTQTKYGAMYWQLTAPLRLGRYRPSGGPQWRRRWG